MQINSWEKNILPWKKIYRSWRIMLKKSLTPLYVREKISNVREVWEKILPIQTKSVKSPIPATPSKTSNGHVNHLEGEGRNWFDTFVNVIHQQNGWRAFMMWWFSRLKFCTSRLKERRWKTTNGKRKFKRMLSVLFVDKRKLFAMKLSFEEFNLVFYTADRSVWLVLNQPRQRGFWRHLRYILYSMIKEKYVFKKEFLYL